MFELTVTDRRDRKVTGRGEPCKSLSLEAAQSVMVRRAGAMLMSGYYGLTALSPRRIEITRMDGQARVTTTWKIREVK